MDEDEFHISVPISKELFDLLTSKEPVSFEDMEREGRQMGIFHPIECPMTFITLPEEDK